MNNSPKLRYADTSYLIYQQWRKGGPVKTFPLLTKYYVDENGVNIRNNLNQKKSKDKRLSKQLNGKPVFKIKDGRGKDKTVKNGNVKGRNYKKRRSRKGTSSEEDENTKENKDAKEEILPPPPPTPPQDPSTPVENVNEIQEYQSISIPNPPPPQLPQEFSTFKSPPTSPLVAKIDEVDQFDTQLHIDEPRNTISSVDEVTEIEVSADIHRSNSESEEDTVIEANNNNIKLDKKLSADRQLQPDMELIIQEIGDLDPKPLFGASMSVPIRRKQYEYPVDIDSLSSVSDLEDAETLIRQLQYGVEQVKNSYNDEEQQVIPKSRSFPVSSSASRNKTATNGTSNALRLHYITERILASVLPGRTHAEVVQRKQNGNCSTTGDEYEDEYERELIMMLEQKHGKNYRVFDLESCLAVITLEKLCELCKHIDSWLGSARERVVVLQDRGDRQRLGSAIAAYLEYQRICGTNSSRASNRSLSPEDTRMQNQIVKNWLDLDIFSMRKFLEELVGPLHVPSYKRYIAYFAGLLSGEIKMNSAALHLNYVILESPPCLHQKSIITADNEWKSFIKIYEGKRCVFISDVYIIPITTKQFIYEIKHPLRLRGDIIVRMFQLIPNARYTDRELISSVQFHTCAITNTEVLFNKFDLDYAYEDERFPNDHKITLIFINTANNEHQRPQVVFQNPLVRVEPLSNCSSLDNLSEASSVHTHGPVDGSLYATILKSPKSLQTSPVKPLRTSTQSLISPPAEFSGKFDTPDSAKFHTLSTSTPQVHGHYEDIKVIQSERTSARNTPTPSVVSYSSRHSIQRASNGYNGEQNGYATVVQNQPQGQPETQQQREFVRSPLTLSMDSGISSSGVVNRGGRGVQGGANSVSPVSFPSQASPQEDRHRELDDLLSDMLMTVQDIPDIETTQARAKNNKGIAPIPTAASSSTSSVTTVVTQKSTTSASGAQQQRELYENSSTTTLTPPPSENGRETPVNRRDKRDLEQQERDLIMSLSGVENELRVNEHGSNSNNAAAAAASSGDSLLKMNLQHHSYLYPQQARIETLSISDTDDDQQSNIPYHAREDSRPFTYGNIPPANSGRTTPALSQQGTMLKTQSGLSSPSMVRKVIIADKKSQQQKPRNEFEDMLMERREKIMSEKYSIGDKTPNGTATNGTTNGYDSKWYHTTTTTNTQQSNGYPYDLLKRSNTLDGSSFRHRNNDTIDGVSGQTWLQLQQQKLRAKREAQGRDFTDNFSRSYGSPTSFNDTIHHSSRRSQTLSPVRNEKYHTISKTNSYSTNERPFVSVKRAHENARHGFNSAPQSPLTVLNASPHGQITHVVASNHGTTEIKKPTPKKVTIPHFDGLSDLEDQIIKSPRSPSRNGFDTTNGSSAREESFSSSYRSDIDNEMSPRPETPAFPVTPRTPNGFGSSPALPPKSPTSQRKDPYGRVGSNAAAESYSHNEIVSNYTSRRNSVTSNANSEPQEVAAHHVKFVRDSSKYWYKPNISRDEAVNLLRNAHPGTFIVRDSTTFANAFGLVLKVAYPPPGVQQKGPPGDELVRHFLVEPTLRGVRLKGCSNEPVFSSLSALVYQHSITPLALPCRLIIPDRDISNVTDYTSPAQQQLLCQGAACNVLYLISVDTESLTGPQAVRKAVSVLFAQRPLPTPTQVHFKVSQQGITLTDNTRRLFFRKNYPAHTISHCGLDPDEHRWSVQALHSDIPVTNHRIYAFVAKRSSTSQDNQCHVFCELEPNQPASAIVSFANKIITATCEQHTLPKNI
ncbi:tensin-1 isoform X2 [Culicoides brevitarsis]|uniref:tensin-1 isoform X2 n=1 Tax=Culicoides brevitarsis TaxID=469753 RepID=UPI00307B9D3A